MRIVFMDRAEWRTKLYPLTLTRPVSELRVGIVTITEKWTKRLKLNHSFLTEDYLSDKYPLTLGDEQEFLFVRGNCCPDDALIDKVQTLSIGDALVDEAGIILAKTDRAGAEKFVSIQDETLFSNHTYHTAFSLDYSEDIFLNNGEQIKLDFDFLTKGRVSAKLSATNQILGDQVFAEEGAKVECSILNSLTGPIYLAKNSEVWENCAVRGPFALGEESQLKMGARVYSNVTVGPFSRVGGEMNTCVILGYSSKGHDGYLGCAVMGEWCNWGADTNNSNLKNNYKPVKVYDYTLKGFRKTNLQFYGLIMGDHSKCAINTAFNTGTIVGVGASIFGAGFPPVFIPDFSWGGPDGFTEYKLENMLDTAELVFARRNRPFDQQESDILKHVFELTADYRRLHIK